MRAGRNEACFAGNLHLIDWLQVPTRVFSAVGHFTGCGIYDIDYNVLEQGGSTYWNRCLFELILCIFYQGWLSLDPFPGLPQLRATLVFPSTLQFACYLCSWNLSETCFLSSTSYVNFRRICICKSIHRRVLQGEKIKKIKRQLER